MYLSDLSKLIDIQKTSNFTKDNFFSSITSNSKFTDNKTVFIYDKNSKQRKEFVKEALKNNIPAIITNKILKFVNIPQFLVFDLESETEILLKNLFKYYHRNTIAVTGTNGKTSVVWYLSQILNFLKHSNSFVGTLGYFKNGNKINETNLTTPAYEELYKYGSSNRKFNNTYIFEASSHAIDQNRIRNYPINIAAITNISIDHLDYHKNFKNYKQAKLNLFNNHLKNNGYAIINSRLKNISSFIKKLKSRKIKIIIYGKKNVYFVKKNENLKLHIYKNSYNINKINLRNDIELENLECAISCCLSLNIKEKNILKVLSKITNPPGRLQEIFYKKKKSKIIIDYAHTPEALKRILKSLSSANKKPALVFGCGGERDKSKRKIMGEIAFKLSSRIYITDDNPRNEDPNKIRKTILKYCPNAIEIPNRKEAINTAINDLKESDTLIIAGKGHENFQIIKNKKYKFDDYQLVSKIINK